MSDPTAQPMQDNPRPGRARRWLDVLPLAWLALVLYGYALLALYPDFSTRGELPATVSMDLPGGTQLELPGLSHVEAAVLPVLAAMVVTAIIRYVCLRDSGVDTAGNNAVQAVGGSQDIP